MKVGKSREESLIGDREELNTEEREGGQITARMCDISSRNNIILAFRCHIILYVAKVTHDKHTHTP